MSDGGEFRCPNCLQPIAETEADAVYKRGHCENCRLPTEAEKLEAARRLKEENDRGELLTDDALLDEMNEGDEWRARGHLERRAEQKKQLKESDRATEEIRRRLASLTASAALGDQSGKEEWIDAAVRSGISVERVTEVMAHLQGFNDKRISHDALAEIAYTMLTA